MIGLLAKNDIQSNRTVLEMLSKIARTNTASSGEKLPTVAWQSSPPIA
jgi:hypothetical protein